MTRSTPSSSPRGFRALSAAVAAAVVSTLAPAMSRAGTAVNVVGLDLQAVDAGLSSGTFTSADLVNAYEARIQQYNPTYNAFIWLNANALQDAQAIDAQRAAGGTHGPLFGVPVVIKNSVDVAGVPTTDGTVTFDSAKGGVDLIPKNDAPVVARLRAAGAIIIGETNAPDFSASYNTNSSVAGQTLNTYGKGILPGGSSGGTATAVSASFAVLGIGEETAGSIQVPSNAQSLVGIKPTFGLVPNSGLLPLATSTRDVLGPMARTVYDAAATLNTIAGYSPDDPKTVAANGNIPAAGYTAGLSTTDLQGKRIGLFGTGFKDVQLAPQTATLYNQAVGVLQSEGATVVNDPFAGSTYSSIYAKATGLEGLESFAHDFNQYVIHLGNGQTATSVAAAYQAKTGNSLYDQGILKVLTGGVAPDFNATPDLTAFNLFKTELLTEFLNVMDANHLDALAFPEAYQEVPTIASDPAGQFYPSTSNSDINIMGTPGVTVPAGYYPDGTPFGLIFLGRPFAEQELLNDAYAFEQATNARVEPTLTAAVPLPPAWAMAGSFAPLGMAAAAAVRRRRRIASA